jgi:hypothetical protein
MRGKHARRLDGSPLVGALNRQSCHLFNIFRRNPAGPQKPHHAVFHFHNGGFNTDRRRSPIQNDRNFAAKICLDSLRRGWRNPAGRIGRRRGKRRPEQPDQFLRRTFRTAQSDSLQPRRNEACDLRSRLQRQDQCQRPGPECLGQLSGQRVELREFICHADARNMNNQRVERRSALGLIYRSHSLAVGGISGKPIHRFRRRSDKPAAAQMRCRPLQIVLSAGKQFRHRSLLFRPALPFQSPSVKRWTEFDKIVTACANGLKRMLCMVFSGCAKVSGQADSNLGSAIWVCQTG